MPSLTPDESNPTGYRHLVALVPRLVLQERYTLQACLGSGAMGEVWLATDSDHGRIVNGKPAQVVLKFLPEAVRLDPVANARFAKEYDRVWLLSHPGICRLFDMGKAAGVGCFQVMQYLEGVTLHQHLHNSGGTLPVREVLSILKQAAAAIDSAHKQGVMHRDLKPENIMYNPTSGVVHLIDFGLAAEIRNTTSMLSRSQQVGCGTEPYMAPEQWRNRRLTPRCDQWALGVIAWQLLTGELPFQGAGGQLGFVICDQPQRALPDSLRRFRGVFRRILAKDPRKRFAGCEHFVKALEECERGGGARLRIAAGLAGLALVGVGLAVYWTVNRGRDVRVGLPAEQSASQSRVASRLIPVPAEGQEDERTMTPSSPPAEVESTAGHDVDAPQPAPGATLPQEPAAVEPMKSRLPKEDSSAAMATTDTAPAAEPATAEPAVSATAPGQIFTNSLGMQFVTIPEGEFQMGSEETVADLERAGFQIPAGYGTDDERPVHRVRISRFQMGVHEVTRGQFAMFVQQTGYKTQAETDGGGYGFDQTTGTYEFVSLYSWRNPGYSQTDDHPVVMISWNDGQEFLQWLSQKEGRRYRMPREAEWEYASRAGSSARYSYGDAAEGLAEVGNVADGTAKSRFSNWTTITAEDGYVFTAPVGSFRANAFGLHDMEGNVWEWCGDWYDKGYYAGSPSSDPQGPSSGSFRVLRGGSWDSAPDYVRCAYRGVNTPDGRSLNFGLRVVLE